MHPGKDSVEKFAGFLQSQAIWDETMAQNVASYLEQHPASKMVVLAGGGHVIRQNGIPPRVKRRIAVDQAVVISSDGSDIQAELADYVIFMAYDALPPKVLIGIVMAVDKESKEVVIEKVQPKYSVISSNKNVPIIK